MISKKQIENVIALPPPKRYSHFVKKTVGWGEVWGLYNDGWALSEDKSGNAIFPVFPEKAYAELCISDEWNSYKPKAIALDDFVNILLPKLKDDGIEIGAFYTLEHGSVEVSIDTLVEDLKNELLNY